MSRGVGVSGGVERQDRYERFVDWSQIPALALSLLLIPVVLMPYAEDLSPWSLRILEVIGLAIWAAFVFEYVTLVVLSTDRWETVRTHKVELLLVLLPFLRPFRVVRLARAGSGLAKAAKAIARIAGRPGFGSTLGAVAGCIATGGLLVSVAEHDQAGSTIDSVADGIWWAFVTCTTVGYGDTFPVTSSGRVIAVVLMLVGISGLSVITANIAAYFVSTVAEGDNGGDNGGDAEGDEVDARLARIEAQLARLVESMDGRSAGGAE